MYIWVVLATFLAILYSFNLSPRSDMREIQVEPVAEAVISKLVIKQQAAGRFVADHSPPKAKYDDGTQATEIIYVAGILEDNTRIGANGHPFGEYLPFGFNNSEDMKAEIYCLSAENYSMTDECKLESARRFLFTYTLIPQRWINVKTGVPNNDFINAMKTIIGNDDRFGYTTMEGGKMHIRSKEGALMEIPEYVYGNGGFSQMCGSGRQSDSDICLVYMFEYKFKSF